MSRFCVRVINYFFYFIVGLFLFVNVVKFSEYVAPSVLEPILSVVIFATIVLFLYLGIGLFVKLKKLLSFTSKFSAVQLGAFLFLFVAITKIILVFLLDTDVNAVADMPNYLDFATQFAENGRITENVIYATRYKYTVVYGLFLSPVVKLFGNDPKVVTSFLSVLYAIISVVLFDIIRKYAGNTKSFWGLLIFNISPVGLFISQVLIHETPLLFLYTLSLWLFLKVISKDIGMVYKIVCLIVSAILISFGTSINKGGSVMIIAYVVFMLVFTFKNKLTIKSVSECVIISTCYLVCFFIVSSVMTSFVTNSIVYLNKEEEHFCKHHEESVIPLGWGLYLGTNIEERGQYNQVDYDTYNKYHDIDDPREAQKYQKEIVEERVQYFVDNSLQIPVHLYYKFKKLYARPFVAIEYCIYNNLFPIMDGLPMILLRSLGNIYNMVISSIILFSYKKHKRDTYELTYINPSLLFKLFFVGITLALIPFEIAQKYVCHTQILLTCIAVMSLSDFISNSNIFKKRIRVRARNTCRKNHLVER